MAYLTTKVVKPKWGRTPEAQFHTIGTGGGSPAPPTTGRIWPRKQS